MSRIRTALLVVVFSFFVSNVFHGVVRGDESSAPARPHVGPAWDLSHGPLRVHRSGRFLEHKDGTPFLFLGDTAWELFHRLSRADAEKYLENRRAKGFTVIQAVALAELNGLVVPSVAGHLPLDNQDPARPLVKPGSDNDYWDDVDYMVDLAEKNGIYIAFVPTWGDKVVQGMWGDGPRVFNPTNALAFGRFLGKKFRKRPNLIWVLGGDRPVVFEQANYLEIWRAMARGIREGDGGNHLITFHPNGERTSSTWLHNEPWLAFNMIQTGHAMRDLPNYQWIEDDYALTPVKPVIDAEPRYEQVSVGFKAENGVFDAFDVRQAAYWAVFAGAFGHTYGHSSVWRMATPNEAPRPNRPPATPWFEALDAPGAQAMLHLRRLLLSRPFDGRVPDHTLIRRSEPLVGQDHVAAVRDRSGGFAMLYLPTGKPITVDVGIIEPADTPPKYPPQQRAWWFNPRNGEATMISEYTVTRRGLQQKFVPPGTPGRGNDWVLVIDDVSRNFSAPGQ